jgi:hypothetical protein
MKKPEYFPQDWTEDRVRRVLEHYEQQSEDEAASEDEEAFGVPRETVMEVPIELVPVVRELIARKSA